jgi:DNA polymerase-1
MEQTNIFDQILEIKDEPGPKKEPVEAPEVKVSYEDFDYDTLNLYAGIDCIATTELLRRQFPRIIEEEPIKDLTLEGKEFDSKAPAIIRSFTQLEIPAQEFLIDLEINGLQYSTPRNAWIGNKMMAQVSELDEKIFSVIGKKIDLNSGKKIAEFLYGERGFKPPGLTKSGEPATDGAAIMTLAGLNPVGGKYIADDPSLQWLADMAVRRDIASSHNTFIKTYVRDFVKADGRVHPSYNQYGTSSFRITGSDPNLTQLPRYKHGFNLRTCYTVEEGKVFISFDFSSAEVKVLANISKEPAMLKAIADGLDFHSFSASAMKKIPYDEIMGVLADKDHPKFKEYKNLRQLSKVLTFSILYGSSVAGIAMQLGLEKEAAQVLVDMYFKAFPKVKNYIDQSHKFALWNQMSLTPLGQRRRQYGTYPCFKPTAAYNASMRGSQNMIIQSTTSTIGLATFAELNRRVKPLGAKCICTVYDSIEIECPLEKAAEVINLAYDVMDNYPLEAFNFMELPIGSESEVGISWGETEVVHKGVTQPEINALIDKIRTKSFASFGGPIYN